MQRCWFAVAIAFLVPPAAPAQAGPRWTIAGTPLLSVGGGDDSTAEFLRAESAIRLSSGALVVLSQRTSELKWFAADGRFQRSVGRRGRGPQEFGRTLYVFDGAGDTVIVHDADNRRFHYLSPRGEFVRLDSVGPRDRQYWLYDRSLIARVPLGVDRERLAAALLRIPFDKREPIRTGLVDRSGVVFLRARKLPSGYAVYDREGHPLGSLALPEGFELYQVFDTLVLGRFRDPDDFEYVQLRRLARAGRETTALPPARPGYDQAAELSAHRAEIGTLRMVGRNLLTAQEAHYARARRYAGSLAELGGGAPPLPPQVSLELLGAGGQSYWVVVSVRGTPFVCVIGIGAEVPFGFVESCG